MEPDYRRLARIAYRLRIISAHMEESANNRDGEGVFVAYCEMIVAHEDIRDIVAGREVRR